MKLGPASLTSLLALVIAGCERSELHFTAPGITVNSKGGQFQASGDVNQIQKAIDASGPVTTDTRNAAEFHAIDAGSIVNVEYVQSERTSVEVSAKKDILSQVKTDVSNGVLHLGLEGNINDPGTVTIKISSPNLDSIQSSGTAHVSCTGKFSGPLAMNIGGASAVELNGSAQSLTLDLGGTGNLDATNLEGASISGNLGGNASAKLGGALTDISLSCSGSSNGQLTGVKAAKCHLELSGNSKIVADGTADELTIDASGASTAELPSLAAKNCEASADGSSQIHVNVAGSIKATASGASGVFYSGKPTQVEPDTSGASTIRPE